MKKPKPCITLWWNTPDIWKHSPAARVFYISLLFSNARRFCHSVIGPLEDPVTYDTELITLGHKLHSVTFETKESRAGLLRVPLFWKFREFKSRSWSDCRTTFPIIRSSFSWNPELFPNHTVSFSFYFVHNVFSNSVQIFTRCHV